MFPITPGQDGRLGYSSRVSGFYPLGGPIDWSTTVTVEPPVDVLLCRDAAFRTCLSKGSKAGGILVDLTRPAGPYRPICTPPPAFHRLAESISLHVTFPALPGTAACVTD